MKPERFILPSLLFVLMLFACKSKQTMALPTPFGGDETDEHVVVANEVEEAPPPLPPPEPILVGSPAPVPQAPSSAPRSMEEASDDAKSIDFAFQKQGRAGIPLSKYATAQGCLGRSKSSFTVGLYPKANMDLVSFVVYANDCGGMSLTITGVEMAETAKIALTKGKNLIVLEDYDIRLRGGAKYTMTCTGIGSYGGCSSTKPPMFEDISKCTNLASNNHPSLVLDQKTAPFIFDFKFLFQ